MLCSQRMLLSWVAQVLFWLIGAADSFIAETFTTNHWSVQLYTFLIILFQKSLRLWDNNQSYVADVGAVGKVQSLNEGPLFPKHYTREWYRLIISNCKFSNTSWNISNPMSLAVIQIVDMCGHFHIWDSWDIMVFWKMSLLIPASDLGKDF